MVLVKDIRIAVSFKGHRKRKKLKMILGLDATDYLIDLWISTAMNHPNGILEGMDQTDIALEAGWEGDPGKFVSALIECGFLEKHVKKNSQQILRVHDWKTHNTWSYHSEERSEIARKAAKALWKNRASGAHAVSKRSACSEHTNSNAPSPSPSPSPKEKTKALKALKEIVSNVGGLPSSKADYETEKDPRKRKEAESQLERMRIENERRGIKI